MNTTTITANIINTVIGATKKLFSGVQAIFLRKALGAGIQEEINGVTNRVSFADLEARETASDQEMFEEETAGFINGIVAGVSNRIDFSALEKMARK